MGWTLTAVYIATAEPVPASRPQNPPFGVARFHIMPSDDRAEERRDEKAHQRLHVVHDAFEVGDKVGGADAER